MFRDYFAAHRTLRYLACRCAQLGMIALRFDYRATGDSTGRPSELTDVTAWIEDVRAAVDEVRRQGVRRVVVVGMRASATMLATAESELGADAMILWDPVVSGRSFLRSLELLIRLDADEASVGASRRSAEAAASPRRPGRHVAGGFSDEFVQSIRALRLENASLEGPALVLTRTGEAPRLSATGPGVEVAVAAGQEDLLEAALHMSVVPLETIELIATWSLAVTGPATPDATTPLSLAPALEPSATDGWYEHPAWFGHRGSRLFGVVTEPCHPGEGVPLTCLFLNSGMQHHVGPDRLYVDLARALARRGVRSVRVDLATLGDSPGGGGVGARTAYPLGALHDLDHLIDDLGAQRLVVLGLCSGGYHALEAAARRPVLAAISIHNPFEIGGILYHPEVADENRRMSTPDGRLVAALRRNYLGRAILWRLPGPMWAILGFLRIQRDVAAGHREAAAAGRTIVMLVEVDDLHSRRAWLVRQRPKGLRVISSTTHHTLERSGDRARVTQLLLGIFDQLEAGSVLRLPDSV